MNHGAVNHYTKDDVLISRILAVCIAACLSSSPAWAENASCDVSLMVLGAGQDGGKPQIANPDDPAWTNPDLRRLATSLALIDARAETPSRWLFEATPDIKEQLQRLDARHPAPDAPGLDGIFLTHAHIGHYTGLALLGHESAGASGVPVHVLPRMAGFLRENGPWDQLVRYENIALEEMTAGEPVDLADGVTVTPFLVPHRQEYSEVAGFSITGPERSVLFIPDIDSWADWDTEEVYIEEEIAAHDVALLDGTFFANGEIPGRDMSGFPHPFITVSVERFSPLPQAERGKIRFIHLNHTNPAIDPASAERAYIRAAGMDVADEGGEICL